MVWFVVLSAFAVVVLVLAEWSAGRGGPTGPVRAAAKTTASTGFVLAALAGGALDGGFGRWVLGALVLSWLGDVLLLGERRSVFLAGLAAFLAAHLLFGVAFVVLGVSGWWLATAALLVVPALAVLGWLRPHLDGRMRLPVAAYVVVISLMAALAAGAVAAGATGWLAVAASGFYLSDLFVARNRFVAPGFVNRLVGLPLYYGAQLLFAWLAGRPSG